MQCRLLVRLLGLVALLSVVVAPVTLAAPLADRDHDDDHGWQGHGYHHEDDRAPVVQVVPVPVFSGQVSAPDLLPVPLQQALGAASFQPTPIQFLPFQPHAYVLVSPMLFCGLDTAANCVALAQQLNTLTSGFGTAILNGPQGYGVYVTYQDEN